MTTRSAQTINGSLGNKFKTSERKPFLSQIDVGKEFLSEIIIDSLKKIVLAHRVDTNQKQQFRLNVSIEILELSLYSLF